MFEIEKDVPLCTNSRRGASTGATAKYPFAVMEVGDSFFVPVSDECPDPVRTMTSSCASAMRRMSVPVEGKVKADRVGNIKPAMAYTRRFAVKAVDGGARVWRTA